MNLELVSYIMQIDQNLYEGIRIKKSESPLITYVGRIKNYKNIDKVIEAISVLKKISQI